MKSKSDFWLTLHKLTYDIEKEGEDHDQRAQSICELLETLPPATRELYLSDLNSVAEMLGKVLARCWED